MGQESAFRARNGQQANRFHSRAAGCIPGIKQTKGLFGQNME